MKLPLLAGAALLSVGWALSETRPTHPTLPPPQPRPVPEVGEPPREARPVPTAMRPPPKAPPPPIPARRVEAPPPPAGVARISGRIIDQDGKPRGDAKADLDLGDLCIWVTPDSQGRFSATLAPGEYSVTAARDDDEDHSSSPVHLVNLEPGGEVKDLVLELHERKIEVDSRIEIEEPTFESDD